MTRKRKAVAVTGVTGVTGVLCALGTNCESGESETMLARARAHVPSNLPVTPVTEERIQENLSSNKVEWLSPVGDFLPVTAPVTPVTGETDRHEGALQSIEHAEALDLPVALWADLPVPSSIRVRTATGRTAWLTASRRRLRVAADAGQAAFGPTEYEAALAGILERRAGPRDLDGWIDRKRATQGGWVLVPLEAVGGAAGLVTPRGRVTRETLGATTFAQALARAGCVAEAVVVENVTQASVQPPEVAFAGL